MLPLVWIAFLIICAAAGAAAYYRWVMQSPVELRRLAAQLIARAVEVEMVDQARVDALAERRRAEAQECARLGVGCAGGEGEGAHGGVSQKGG